MFCRRGRVLCEVIKATVLILFFLIFFITSREASAYTSSFDLTFATEDQSMWSSGGAFVLDYTNEFARLDWDLSKTVGDVVGGTGTWCATRWGPCYSYDTRTGAEIEGSTSGYVGMEFTTHIDSGTVDVNYPVSIDLAFPDAYTVRPETNFQIDTSYTVDQGSSLYTSFPGISAELSFLYNIQAQAGGTAMFLGTDLYDGSATLIETGDESFSLLSVSGQGVESPFLDLFQLADALSDLSETTSENANKDKNEMDPDKNKDSKKKNVNLADFFSIDVGIPDIYTIGELDENMLQSSGEDDFLTATLDLDNVLTSAFGLPGLLGQSKDFGFGTMGYDILDVQAGAALAVTQEFSFDPGLKGRLDFSDSLLMPVEVFDHYEVNNDYFSQLAWKTFQPYGASIEIFCGQFNSLCSSVTRTEYQLSNSIEYALGDSLEFMFPIGIESVFATPTFFLDNVFANNTGMRVDPLITEKLLSFELFGLGLSVYEGEQRFDVGADIDIFSNQFALGGFDSFTLEPFTLNALVDSAPVPEPSTFLLLGSGLAGLGFYARKRRRA